MKKLVLIGISLFLGLAAIGTQAAITIPLPPLLKTVRPIVQPSLPRLPELKKPSISELVSNETELLALIQSQV